MIYHKCFKDQKSSIENNKDIINKIDSASNPRKVLEFLMYVEHDAGNCNCEEVLNHAFARVKILI
jgi:hypothetical protein